MVFINTVFTFKNGSCLRLLTARCQLREIVSFPRESKMPSNPDLISTRKWHITYVEHIRLNFEIVDYILTYLLPQATVVPGKFSMLDVVFTFLFYKFFISSWRLSGQ